MASTHHVWVFTSGAQEILRINVHSEGAAVERKGVQHGPTVSQANEGIRMSHS